MGINPDQDPPGRGRIVNRVNPGHLGSPLYIQSIQRKARNPSFWSAKNSARLMVTGVWQINALRQNNAVYRAKCC